VRRGVVAAVAVVVATETHVFVLLFRRNRLSGLLTHGWEARRRSAEKNERSARRWESGGKARKVPNTHHRLARSRAPNGRRRPVQRAVRSCAGPSTQGRVVGWKETACKRIQRPRLGWRWQVVTMRDGGILLILWLMGF
jgi:hypothetical protein